MKISIFVIVIVLNLSLINANYECGLQNHISVEIIGGRSSDVSQWPWSASLFKENENSKKFFCGATLITDQHLLTGLLSL